METLAFDEAGKAIPASKLLFDGDGGLAFRLQLSGRAAVGFRARRFTGVIDLASEGSCDPAEFWDPVFSRRGSLIVEPEQFYIFASKERIRIPVGYAAEMLPIDVGVGELRTNYAGFFDPGFGGHVDGVAGTPAILEVRPHDVPFLVEDGQVFFRLRFSDVRRSRPSPTARPRRDRTTGANDSPSPNSSATPTHPRRGSPVSAPAEEPQVVFLGRRMAVGDFRPWMRLLVMGEC